jgi:hypothetical protein
MTFSTFMDDNEQGLMRVPEKIAATRGNSSSVCTCALASTLAVNVAGRRHVAVCHTAGSWNRILTERFFLKYAHGVSAMGRYLLLWLIGVPLPILLLIAVFGGLH